MFMYLPHNVFIGEYPGVLGEGLVWLLLHLLKLVVSHPLKQSTHVLLTSLQLHPLGRCECMQWWGETERSFLSMLYIVKYMYTCKSKELSSKHTT